MNKIKGKRRQRKVRVENNSLTFSFLPQDDLSSQSFPKENILGIKLNYIPFSKTISAGKK
jgi:hypothetical protein